MRSLSTTHSRAASASSQLLALRRGAASGAGPARGAPPIALLHRLRVDVHQLDPLARLKTVEKLCALISSSTSAAAASPDSHSVLSAAEDVIVSLLAHPLPFDTAISILSAYVEKGSCPRRVFDAAVPALLAPGVMSHASARELGIVMLASARAQDDGSGSSIADPGLLACHSAVLDAAMHAVATSAPSANAHFRQDLALLLSATSFADVHAADLFRAAAPTITSMVQELGTSASPCIVSLTRAAWALSDLATAYCRQAVVLGPLVDAFADGAGRISGALLHYCETARFLPLQPRLAALRPLAALTYRSALLGGLLRRSEALVLALQVAVLLPLLPSRGGGSAEQQQQQYSAASPNQLLFGMPTTPDALRQQQVCIQAVPYWIRSQLHLVHLGILARLHSSPRSSGEIGRSSGVAPLDHSVCLRVLPLVFAEALRNSIAEGLRASTAADSTRVHRPRQRKQQRSHRRPHSSSSASSSLLLLRDGMNSTNDKAAATTNTAPRPLSHVEHLVFEAVQSIAVLRGWGRPAAEFETPFGLHIDVALPSMVPSAGVLYTPSFDWKAVGTEAIPPMYVSYTPLGISPTATAIVSCDGSNASVNPDSGVQSCGSTNGAWACIACCGGDSSRGVLDAASSVATPHAAHDAHHRLQQQQRRHVAIEVDGPWHYVHAAPAAASASARGDGNDGRIQPLHQQSAGEQQDAMEGAALETIFLGASSDDTSVTPRRKGTAIAATIGTVGRPSPPAPAALSLDLLTVYRRWLLRSFGWRVVTVPFVDHEPFLLGRSLAKRRVYVERRVRESGMALA